MNTLIWAGGSGSRVLEAILHLCAAGLGPQNLRILGIDTDGANGNTSRMKGLLDMYLECHQRFAGKLGNLRLFGTKLDLFDTEGGENVLKIWAPIQTGDTLSDLLNYDNLDATKTPSDVVHLLFTEDELHTELDRGFLGHTAIGAAAMSLLSLHANQQPWKQVIEKLRGDIAQLDGARVMLVGSVFGGTGASAIHPVARFLRTVPEANSANLKIGVAALVPYFRFEKSTTSVDSKTKMTVKSEWFPLATRSSVQFYQHLRENRDWQFDAIYWIGDNSPMEVSYSPGGSEQKNPAHFVDLLAAFSCLEFFENPVTTKACYYSGPRQDVEPQLNERNLLDWLDIPFNYFAQDDIRTKLLQFFLAGFVHLGFCDELLRMEDIDRRPFCVPWYLERFALNDDWFASQENLEALDLLTNYFKKYHFTWWDQIHRQELVRLFNRAAIHKNSDDTADVELNRIANLLWPDKSGEANLDNFDSFFTDMVRVPKTKGGNKGVATYLALLVHAAESYIKREYKKTRK